jgi:hypothetical protein
MPTIKVTHLEIRKTTVFKTKIKFWILIILFRLNYIPVKTLDEVVDVFTRETNDPKVDSVEGIMYSLNEGSIDKNLFIKKTDKQ